MEVLYAGLVEGISRSLPPTVTIEVYLQSLQPHVKSLRKSYASATVSINYADRLIQSAYLITYFPHYYQLIYNILLEDCARLFADKSSVSINIIGGGPGTEAFGVIKFIKNNCKTVKRITINIFDLNSKTWQFSHRVLQDPLINSILGEIDLTWNSYPFDILAEQDVKAQKGHFESGDLLIIQNCLNEIHPSKFDVLSRNVESIFKYIAQSSIFILSDQTSGCRSLLIRLETELVEKYKPKTVTSTLRRLSSSSMISVHHSPSEIVRRNVLNGTDGLIPRKNIKYDYSLISKNSIEDHSVEPLGLQAIYRPLDFSNLDANDFIHKKVFVGIDFGTSCTVISVAWLLGSQISVKAISISQSDHRGDKLRSPLVASALAYFADSKRLLVGQHAAEWKAELEYGLSCWHSLKSMMMNLKSESYENSLLKNHPQFPIGSAHEALVLFFKYLKREIESTLRIEGLPPMPGYAFSVPAGFTSQEKQALKDCLKEAQIDCEDIPFIDEPNACLINHLYEEEVFKGTEKEANVLVIDIGAGTVDISIVALSLVTGGLNSKLLSTFRQGNIGSSSIDRLIFQNIIAKSTVNDIEYAKVIEIDLLHHAELLKIKLCRSIQIDKDNTYSLPQKAFSERRVHTPLNDKLSKLGFEKWDLSYAEFNDIMVSYWEGKADFIGVVQCVESAVKSAGLKKDEISKVIVSGGGARNPYIQAFASRYFQSSQVLIPDNIQEQVSRGVALHSFVVNSFGKNIVTPILCHDVYLNGASDGKKIFGAGAPVPSDDVDYNFKHPRSQQTRHIRSFYSDPQYNVKFFVIPPDTQIEKLIFYVDSDQELRCDIVTNDMVIKAVEIFLPNESNYLPLN